MSKLIYGKCVTLIGCFTVLDCNVKEEGFSKQFKIDEKGSLMVFKELLFIDLGSLLKKDIVVARNLLPSLK